MPFLIAQNMHVLVNTSGLFAVVILCYQYRTLRTLVPLRSNALLDALSASDILCRRTKLFMLLERIDLETTATWLKNYWYREKRSDEHECHYRTH